ncbi:MAG: phosphonate ABC transporter, permease protein PhnE, partial [Rhodobacteraceae bacterium]|nr:phosphonate ABC transporter, permease protein PhnE [Paracoccaceae bacterium]
MGRSIWSALFDIKGPADMTSTSDPKLDSIKFGYMGMVRQKRSYSLILLIVFVALLVSGFLTA